MLPVLREHGAFGVNILAGGHREVADRFAGRRGLHGPQRYVGAEWMTLVSGASLLVDSLAAIDCSVEDITEWHSHAVVIGRVEGVHLQGGPQALVHWRGGYIDV